MKIGHVLFILDGVNERNFKVTKALKDLFFVLIVCVAAGNRSCIHNKKLMLGVNENWSCTFRIRWNE